MSDFLLPTSLDLKEVEMDLLPRLMADRPIFDHFPIVEVDQAEVAWEQQDNFTGLQQVRGMNGAPPSIKRTGAKRYITQPGIYGEFSVIDENELTRRRQYGTFGNPINIADLVAIDQQRLLQRRLDRIELIGWTLLATGTFSVSSLSGAVAHTDTYTTQTFSASVPWATSATATPLADLRATKLLGRGHSVLFDRNAVVVMNSTTANRLYSNTNAADLFGRRTAGLGTFNSPDQINQLFMGDNLPQIVEYDQGYLDDSSTFQLYIPTGKAILIGRRPSNVPVGHYQMTRNAQNPSLAPGAYSIVVDQGDHGQVPRSIEVHDGHNGGPTLEFGSAVVVMSV